MNAPTEQGTQVSAGKTNQLPAEPPPGVAGALRSRMSPREQQMLGTVFAVRSTAQQMDNAVSEWMADSAASPARFQILSLLWAAKKRGVPHKEIVAALGVTRATISELMAALERDGLVTSAQCSDDRRSVLASLTRKGEAVVEKAVESNKVRLREVFGGMSPEELTTLTTLLERVRQGVSGASDARRLEKRRES
jgi:DNA-binding MarR family transcriptional regulator